MTKQHINLGTSENAKNGDPIRTAFDKVNQNFDELYSNLTSYLPSPAGKSGKFLSTNGTDLLWTAATKFVQSATPPTGDTSTLWYDEVGGRVYTWFDDAWVDASPALNDYKLTPPTSPQGAIGDVEGQWSGDFNYYYYCSENYTGNAVPIWRRIAFDSSNNWGIYNGSGNGSLPANAVGYLYNNGSGTITWTPNTQGYTLPQATTGTLGGVIVDGVSIISNSGVISSAPQLNADWISSSGPSAILNKPTIPAAQIQSDWTVTDNTRLSFIKNKPSIPNVSNFSFSANQITVANNGAIRFLTNTHSWSFNANGSLTYPDNSVQVTAYTGPNWPTQVGNGGKFLTTDGNILSWATVSGSGTTLPSQTDNSGKYLTTNGTTLSWANQYHLGDDLQFVDVDPASGMVVIQSGFDTGMSVYIKGANCSNGGVGGNVVIEAGGAPLPNVGTTGNIELAAQQTTIESNNNMWTFRDDGVLELPGGGTVSYTPATETDWDSTAPTTIQEAIDRLASAFKILNNGTGA